MLTRRSLLKAGVASLGSVSLAQIGINPITIISQAATSSPSKARRQIPLDGEWAFQLDPMDAGEQQRWYSNPEKLRGRISVPGCWQAQGYGEPTGILKHHYIGPAWYFKEVLIPGDWTEKSLDLVVGGAFTYVTAYVNGKRVGQHAGFSTPFRFDITPFIKPGGSNCISLRVANARHHQAHIDMAKNDYSEPTGALNYLARWGGIYRSVRLEAHNSTSIRRIWVAGHQIPGTVHLNVSLHNGSSSDFSGRLQVNVCSRTGAGAVEAVKSVSLPRRSKREFVVELKIRNPRRWSPEEPNLYDASVSLYHDGRLIDEAEESFGIREIRIQRNKILLNGKPLYLRGYGDDSVYVISGTPPTTKDVYLQRLKLAKDLGFNAVRFHSWTPTAEFFEAADEVGMLVMAELPVAYASYFLPNREFLRDEMIRIIKAYRNHPSWLSMALGNEFNVHRLKEQERPVFLETVRQFVELAKRLDPARLILSNDGYFVRPTDITSLYHGFSSEIPTIKHEFSAYYCSLPDVSLIDRFTGVVRPQWLETKRDWLWAKGLSEVYPIYLQNSWRLLQVARKAHIENLRRLDQITGYQYWLMTDYPEGTPEGAAWEWGWCNYFWEPKAGDRTEDHAINSSILPLVGLEVDDRTMWAEQPKEADAFISNYGSEPVTNGDFQWELHQDEQQVTGGNFRVSAPLGRVTRVGRLRIEKIPITEACKLRLSAMVSVGTHTYKNQWNLWAFPRSGLMQASEVPVRSNLKSQALFHYFPFIKPFEEGVDAVSESVLIASDLNMKVVGALEKGGRGAHSR